MNVIKKSDGYRPPISARALSYLGLAAYEKSSMFYKEVTEVYEAVKN